MGTGFAHPNPNSTMQMEPKRSRCRNGLRVNRPWYFAVGSPILLAAQAWAYSWKGNAVSMAMTLTNMVKILSELNEKGIFLIFLSKSLITSLKYLDNVFIIPVSIVKYKQSTRKFKEFLECPCFTHRQNDTTSEREIFYLSYFYFKNLLIFSNRSDKIISLCNSKGGAEYGEMWFLRKRRFFWY